MKLTVFDMIISCIHWQEGRKKGKVEKGDMEGQKGRTEGIRDEGKKKSKGGRGGKKGRPY